MNWIRFWGTEAKVVSRRFVLMRVVVLSMLAKRERHLTDSCFWNVLCRTLTDRECSNDLTGSQVLELPGVQCVSRRPLRSAQFHTCMCNQSSD